VLVRGEGRSKGRLRWAVGFERRQLQDAGKRKRGSSKKQSAEMVKEGVEIVKEQGEKGRRGSDNLKTALGVVS